MKLRTLTGSAIIALLTLISTLPPARALAPGQAFLGTPSLSAFDPADPAADAPDAGQYADATRAINESRWSDAISLFTRIAGQNSAHADGALYWKAYAENKLGKPGSALATCSELRRGYPASRWVEECGALDIQIRSSSGKSVQLDPAQSDDLQLLQLDSILRKDEARALPQIEAVLKGDATEKFKEGALFLLTQGESGQARNLLRRVAQGSLDPAHSNPALQARANLLLNNLASGPIGSPYPGVDRSRLLTLDVVVTDKSGRPVPGLQAGDFSLLDNKAPQSLASFQAASGFAAEADPPVEAILVLDAVNLDFNSAANERKLLADFLGRNGGHLALPTSLVLLTDSGARFQDSPTRDGNTLVAYLNNNATGLPIFAKGSGLYSAEERWKISLRSLDSLLVNAGKRPGRKLLLWLSSGWPAFSQMTAMNTANKQQKLFESIAAFSTGLRNARTTLYSIDPVGAGQEQSVYVKAAESETERLNQPFMQSVSAGPGQLYYQEYVKGVDQPRHANYGNLLLGVLATQSGGQVLYGSNDLATMIDRSLADANAYYVLTFIPPPATHPNEYHGIEVKVGKSGLKARTLTGYYAQLAASPASRPDSTVQQLPQ